VSDALAPAPGVEVSRQSRRGASVITYLVAGKTSAPAMPLVLLHGIGSAARSFRFQLDGLSAKRRVIAWDAPGYGGSTALTPLSPTAEDYAARLLSFLDDLEIDRCHLLGHSLGCLMAARFALRHPGRVQTLSLCGIATGHGPLPPEERQKLLDQRVNDINTLGPAEMAAKRGPRLCAPGATPETIQRVIETMSSVRPDGYAQAARMLSTGDTKADVAALPADLPLQIVYGDADVITPPARNLEVAALRPGVRVTAIPAAGHALYLEQPEAFNKAIESFL
jgi:pimeloyl-ACP methyl ester carboxylesterase